MTMNNNPPESSTRAGAFDLADQISAYWRERSCVVRVYAAGYPPERPTVWGVRSDLGLGLPRQGKVAAE